MMNKSAGAILIDAHGILEKITMYTHSNVVTFVPLYNTMVLDLFFLRKLRFEKGMYKPGRSRS